MLDEYYESRGWDIDSGIPEESTLKRLGILDLVNGVLDEGLILRR
jgi:aldehyde:ferredoxin oxidoreductase